MCLTIHTYSDKELALKILRASKKHEERFKDVPPDQYGSDKLREMLQDEIKNPFFSVMAHLALDNYSYDTVEECCHILGFDVTRPETWRLDDEQA